MRPKDQLLLDFPAKASPGFDRFLGQANRELLQVLQQRSQRFVLVWGAPGSGKSHLLRAWVAAAQADGLSACYMDAAVQPLLPEMPLPDCIALDQVEALDAEGQGRLFTLFNDVYHGGGGQLLLSAHLPPAQLALREDVRTRMALCLVYQIKPLSDEEKIAALQEMAHQRQIPVDEAVFHYLLRHWRRDIDSLVQMLDVLDAHSLTHQRPITVPLLRTLLQQQENV